MNHPAAHGPSSSGPSEDFTWLSNPLDWRPIDRFILLGGLLLIAPALFGFALLSAMTFAPDYIGFTIARLLLAMYALHGLMLAGYIGEALRRRLYDDDWPAFENVIIVSFVIIVLVSSYVTGTHLTEGLLMVFLGINIASALANVTKVQVAYVYICIVISVLVIIDFSDLLPAAPLFVKAPLKSNGSPVAGWLCRQRSVPSFSPSGISVWLLSGAGWTARISTATCLWLTVLLVLPIVAPLWSAARVNSCVPNA